MLVKVYCQERFDAPLSTTILKPVFNTRNAVGKLPLLDSIERYWTQVLILKVEPDVYAVENAKYSLRYLKMSSGGSIESASSMLQCDDPKYAHSRQPMLLVRLYDNGMSWPMGR